MSRNLLLIFIFKLFFLFAVEGQTVYQPNWASLSARPIPEWFGKAKFGIFIHWGVYSVPAWATNSNADGFGSNYAEWYWQRLFATDLKIHKEFVSFHQKTYGPNFQYQHFAPKFTAELFDPKFWATIFKQSGAKYVVLTSKHHDGYTLWPSAASMNWNAVDVGPHRDLVGEITQAVKEQGLHMGLYYSLYEWFNRTYLTDVNKYVAEKMLPELKDITNTYKPDLIWSDGDWTKSDTVWRSKEFLTWLYNESPVKNTIAVNDRWGAGNGKGGYTSSEYGHGKPNFEKPWEETRAIGESFGYNRNENIDQYATSEKLVHQLVDVVSRGGNFLLDIGPAADGTIPVIMQQRLKDIGDWLTVNGEAIYETNAWKDAPSQSQNGVYFTRKGTSLYAIVTKWSKEIRITNIKSGKVSMLGFEGKIRTTHKRNDLIISAADINPGNMPCNYAWVYKVANAF